MNTVERIYKLCEERGVSIARLEKMCGFSNGYFRKLKKGVLPADRLLIVARCLDVEPAYLYATEGTAKLPSPILESIAYIEEHWDKNKFQSCYRERRRKEPAGKMAGICRRSYRS